VFGLFVFEVGNRIALELGVAVEEKRVPIETTPSQMGVIDLD